MLGQRVLLSTVALGLMLQLTPASGQEEEILVTARKRQESILKVPVIATAIPQDSLEKYQTHDLTAVANRVPGFLVGGSLGSVGVQVSIRGIGTTAVLGTIDQSVVLNVDGLQLSQGLAYRAAMFDIGQVEVLKGPQALFYGKNSPGGVISLRGADPTNEHEVILRSGYEFEAAEKVGEIILSGPITDKLKVRVAAQYSNQDGYFQNLAVAVPGLGARTPTFRNFPETSAIVRGTVLFNPAEWYDARLKMNYTKDELEGSGYEPQLGFCPDGIVNKVPGGFQYINSSEDCKLDRVTRIAWADPASWPGVRGGGAPFNDIWQAFGSLEQNFHITPSLTLTSVTGFYTAQQENLINGTTTSSTLQNMADLTFFNRQFTQEMRLESDYKDSPVNFMVGGFVQEGFWTSYLRSLRNKALGHPTGLSHYTKHKVATYSQSVFGQLRWDVIPSKVEIAAGARWTREVRTHQEITFLCNFGAAFGCPAGSAGTLPQSVGVFGVPMGVPRIASDNLSPEVTVTYTPTDDLTIFGSYKQGFKSGSFNTITFLAPGTRSDFGDEGVRGGEAGVKARLLDRRLLANLAVYRYHYRDLQVGAQEISPSGQLLNRTLNAASANIHGVDFDVSYEPPRIEGLTLRAAVNYNHARYGTFRNAPCGNGQTFSQGCNQLPSATGQGRAQDLSHRPLVRAPDWNLNFGFDYEMPVGDMTLSFGSLTLWSSQYYTSLVTRRGWDQPAYFKTNANIALKGPAGAWEIAVIANNLTDEITAGQRGSSPTVGGVVAVPTGEQSGFATAGVNGDDEVIANGERGREVWIRLTLRPLAWIK